MGLVQRLGSIILEMERWGRHWPVPRLISEASRTCHAPVRCACSFAISTSCCRRLHLSTRLSCCRIRSRTTTWTAILFLAAFALISYTHVWEMRASRYNFMLTTPSSCSLLPSSLDEHETKVNDQQPTCTSHRYSCHIFSDLTRSVADRRSTRPITSRGFVAVYLYSDRTFSLFHDVSP